MAFPSRDQFSSGSQPCLGALLPQVNTSNNEESSIDSEDDGSDRSEPLITISDNDSEEEPLQSDPAVNDGQSSVESGDADVDQTYPLNEVPDDGSEEGLLYSDSEVEDEGSIGSSILYEQYEEAQIGKSNERVEILEEEMSSIYRLLQAERRESSDEISALVQELLDEIGQAELSRMSIHDSITDEELQAQNTDFQERIGVLERQLGTLRRENTALSRKVQYVEYLENLDDQLSNDHILQKLGEWEESIRTEAAEQATQLQQTIDGLERQKATLESRLHRQQQNIVQRISAAHEPLGQINPASAQELVEARAEMKRLQDTVQKQQSMIELKEQQIFKLTRTEVQAFDHFDRSGLPRADHSAAPPANFERDELQPTEADESMEEQEAAAFASDVEEPSAEQSQLDSETLRLRNQELEHSNRGLQEQHVKWQKLFKKFMERAPALKRNYVSKHQIKKGFKVLHKIVKEAKLQDL